MSILKTVADSVLTSFLSSMIYDGSTYIISNLWNGDKDLEKLKAIHGQELSRLRTALESINANLSHLDLPSEWLDELESCRYEIEDIEESMKPDDDHQKRLVQKFLETNIKCITEMQEMLAKREEDMEFLQAKGEQGEVPIGQNGRVPPQLVMSTLIRREERIKVIEELTTGSDSSGVSIVGICGTGKTVLAKAIADDASIKAHFHCILDAPPSPVFSSDTLLDHIQSRRLAASGDKRVLILLDGLHSVAPDGWHRFLSRCQEASIRDIKVLITTQNPQVAHVTGTSKHRLHPLSDYECFSLIQHGATANRNLCDADAYAIEHNRKELVDMCNGLPLLANQIGVLLSAAEREQRLGTIKEITTRGLWTVPDLKRVLVDPNSTSLHDPHLKRCLAYCSLFPRDYEFKEEDLVQLWMAEGFTRPSGLVSHLERGTRKYFEYLLSCSFFETSDLPPSDKPVYKMHKLACDLARHVASNLFCRKYIGNQPISTPQISNITRHFSLSFEHKGDDDDEIVVDDLLDGIQKLCSGLRTFLLFHDAGKNIRKNPTFFCSLTRLRVLDLSHTNLTKLYISHLKYLRYLDLSHTPVENLPKLSKNLELQVLKLNYCDKLLDLPKDLTKLANLVSLQVNPRALGSLPSGLGRLTNLLRLNVFIVGKKKGLKIEELGDLNNLRNSLRVTKLENVETEQEAQRAKLHDKGGLDRLELEWSSLTQSEAAKQVLQGLRPPKNLKELKIRNYGSLEFPEWLNTPQMCGLLEYIHLDHCKALPSFDQLPLLKTLRVEAMHKMSTHVRGHEHSGTNGTTRGSPRIETLILCDMPELNWWIKLAARHMPNLCNVRVEKCPSLLSLPHLLCLAKLERLEIIRCIKLLELPVLPMSLKSLIIKHSDVLKQRYQDGRSDRFRGISNVEIDSCKWICSEPHRARSGRPSTSVQDQRTANEDQPIHL